MTIKKRGGGVGCWMGALLGGWGAVVGWGVVRMYSFVLKGKRALSQKKGEEMEIGRA